VFASTTIGWPSGGHIEHPGEPLTGQNVTRFIQQCADKMDKLTREYGVDKTGRWLVVPQFIFHPVTQPGFFLLRERAVKLRLMGGARKAYIRSRRNSMKKG